MISEKVFFIREKFKWMGKYSGYDCLCEAVIELDQIKNRSYWRRLDRPLPRGMRRLFSYFPDKAKGSPFYTNDCALTELEVIFESLYNCPNFIHVTYVENSLGILPSWRKYSHAKLIGTVHQPSRWWQSEHLYPEILSGLDALITLTSQDIEYFETYLPGRVYFIPHGVDTFFFRPNEKSDRKESIRCIFSGQYERDFETLLKVIQQIVYQEPNLQFDLVVPEHKCPPNFVEAVSMYEQVSWHTGISDEELLRLYQRADILLLPLLNCTANNALVEAIACGLPVVSNDVGGIRDYTASNFADLLPAHDIQGLVNAVLRLASSAQDRLAKSSLARDFAEKYLSWDKIAIKTVEVYRASLDDKAKPS